MKITKKEIKDRVKANGGFRGRRGAAQIVEEIQSCAMGGMQEKERIMAILWTLGFSTMQAELETDRLLETAATPEPLPVDRAALRKQRKAEAKVRREQEKLARWTGQ